jgi:hypothetical protein
MKRKLNPLAIAAVLAALLTGSAHAASIGASFIGRNGGNVNLQRNESAGVVVQQNWNNIDDSVTTPAENGISNPLLDSAGNATAVELSFAANDSWSSDGPVVTPNDKLMKGIIKRQQADTSATFYFTNLAAGNYDVYVYGAVNGGPVNLEVTAGGVTKYWAEPASFDGTLTESDSTAAGNYADGEYVKFTGVAASSGAILVSAKYISGSDGLGIAGFQLVSSGAFAANTKPVAITTPPAGRTVAAGENVTLSVAHSGTATSYQWFKDNTAVAGATGSSLTINNAAASHSGSYTVEVKNNVNTVVSAAAVLQVNEPVFTEGLLKQEFWANGTRPAVLDGSAGVPTRVSAVAGVNVPGQGDNYAQRISGLFIPATSGQYVFFINSDDDSDLFLSTDATPANKKLIAQEAAWSNSLQWNTPGGGASTAEDKRSDFFLNSEWPTPNLITLTANQRYYLEVVHHEGGGGDHLQLYVKKAEEEDPANGAAVSYAGGKFGFFALPATVAFTTQPQSQNVVEGKTATLTVAATTTSEFGISAYQWKKNGVAIPGATSPSYTIPVQALSDSGTKYSVDVLAPGAGAVSSAEATITVVNDTTPPVALSAGSLKNFTGPSEVGIIFDEAIAPGSITALGNYTLNNGATVTAARLVTNSSGLNRLEQGIILTVNNLTAGNNYTLTVKGVADGKGNAIVTPQNLNFTASAFSWVSIGDTANGVSNEAIAIGQDGFNVVNGGNAFWNTDDDITMVYETINGDFDKQAQVEWNDPSSQWARAGISARESLNNGQGTTGTDDVNPASRYQMIISDPETMYNGAAANRQYETNRRRQTGGATDGSGAGGTPTYPDSWVRLKRVGQNISMFYSSDGKSWRPLGTSDFADPTLEQPPLPAQMFVGPTVGVENGNIPEESGKRGAYAARFRNYGNVPQIARGNHTYAIGLNLGANEAGAQLGAADVAGADPVAQSNWNNLFGMNTVDTGPATGIVADRANGASAATPVTVEWDSPNTWASHGPRGEQNNGGLTGNNQVLMTGFLDTGNATTTRITINNIPSDLTSAGYDVVVYMLGGVPGRGGGYRVTDTSGNSLTGDFIRAQGPANPTNLTQAIGDNAAATPPTGAFVVFTNLKASAIIVEGATEGTLADGTTALAFGGTPRAPINAVQLITPSGLTKVQNPPTLSIARTANGVSITFEGRLQSSDVVNTGYTDVAGATSPHNTAATGTRFYRAVR